MSAEACRNCLYWASVAPPDGSDWRTDHPFHGFSDMGRCRRHPPAFLGQQPVDDEREYAEWQGAAQPVTADDDWCGEHRPKPNSSAP